MLKTTSEYLDVLRRYKATNASRLGISKMGIFGSVARGEQQENSDVDVFIEMEKPDYFVLCDIREELEHLFGCKVDLVTLHKWMRPLFRKNIDRDAILA